MRGAVRVILNTFNLANNAIFITLEIYNALALLVTTTTMTCGNTTSTVTTTSLALLLEQRRIRLSLVQVSINNLNDVALAR